MNQILTQLAKPVNIHPLVVFRWGFGLLIALESFGAIALGWVKRVMVDPQFTFTFIGFEWLQPLPGYGMYAYYALMGIMGILVMLGVKYRYSLGTFTLLWWGSYLMQKSSYNNHYYLLILICLLMLVVPAHANGSWDARRSPGLRSNYCPQWCIKVFQYLLFIVYTYAGLAKLYPGWWEGHFIAAAFSQKASYPLIGGLLQINWVQKAVMLGGIIFDLSIIPLLWYRNTRWLGVVFSLFFHLFNSMVFGIGIFPYLMLAALVFFFPEVKFGQKWFSEPEEEAPVAYTLSPWLMGALGVFFAFQIFLPLRHHLFKGDVLWTEEGHRMSWRMMLRTKSGYVRFRVVDQDSGKTTVIDPGEYLTSKQAARLATHPDMIWQFSRFLSEKLAKNRSSDLQIYAEGRISVNRGPMQVYIDPEVDLLSVDWTRFKHKSWILLPEKNDLNIED